MLRKYLSAAGVFAIALAMAACFWRIASAEKATTESLGGKDRCLTFISTDKPLYRPGERRDSSLRSE